MEQQAIVQPPEHRRAWHLIEVIERHYEQSGRPSNAVCELHPPDFECLRSLVVYQSRHTSNPHNTKSLQTADGFQWKHVQVVSNELVLGGQARFSGEFGVGMPLGDADGV